MKGIVLIFICVAMIQVFYAMNDEIEEPDTNSYHYESFTKKLYTNKKRPNSNLPKCCQEKCYAHKFCLPLYYVLSCLCVADNDGIPLGCCCCDNPDEKF